MSPLARLKPSLAEGVMSDAMIGLVGGLVGVVIGFVLEVGRSWWSDRRKAQEQAEAIRIVIQHELNHNFKILQGYQTIANYCKKFDLEKILTTKQSFVNPSFSYKVWDSQLSLVGTALTSSEIQKTLNFYNRIDYVDSLRLEITEDNLSSQAYKRRIEVMLAIVEETIKRECSLLVELPKDN